MKITICDICKKEPTESIRLNNGNTQYGPDGLEDQTEYFDLCLEHMAFVANELKRKATQQSICTLLRKRKYND